MSKQPPSAPTASAVGPCPTVIQIVGRPGTGGSGRVVRWSWVNFQCRGVLLVWIRVGQGPIRVGQRPTALAVGAGGGCLDIYSRLSFLCTLSLSLGDDPI